MKSKLFVLYMLTVFGLSNAAAEDGQAEKDKGSSSSSLVQQHIAYFNALAKKKDEERQAAEKKVDNLADFSDDSDDGFFSDTDDYYGASYRMCQRELRRCLSMLDGTREDEETVKGDVAGDFGWKVGKYRGIPAWNIYR